VKGKLSTEREIDIIKVPYLEMFVIARMIIVITDHHGRAV
jgi:hypothetical protein